MTYKIALMHIVMTPPKGLYIPRFWSLKVQVIPKPLVIRVRVRSLQLT